MKRKLSRRDVLVRGTGLGMGAVGVMLSIPAIGFLLSPLFSKQRLSWVTVGSIENVPLNVPTPMVANIPVGTGYASTPVRRIVYVVRQSDGSTLALSNICTHMQCDVHWDPTLGRFLCPCHGGLYAIDGTNVGGPPPQPLPQWTHRFAYDENGNRVLQVQNTLDERI